MKSLIISIILILFSVASYASDSGTTISVPFNIVGSGGNSASIDAKFTCRSFNKTASSTETLPGILNIKYGDAMMCSADNTVIQGTIVNGANGSSWVPEVYFDWDWDDNSLGTVTRGGIVMDLGRSVGVVAAHAFKPSVFADSCGGGTNHLHRVRLTVYSMISGARESDTTTLDVCVENPATTWPNPVAYCDDANCADDVFTNVVNPGTPVHGGNLTALNTILTSCGAGSKRILVKGGVTFSTGSTTIGMGANHCLIESYGTGNAKLKFTSTGSSSTAIVANSANCAGVVFNDVTFAGSGAAPRLVATGLETGCIAMIDSNVSTDPAEGLTALGIISPAGGIERGLEVYFIRFTFNNQGGGIAELYTKVDYLAVVGSELSHGGNPPPVNGEHNFRVVKGRYVVLDATLLTDQQYCRQTNVPPQPGCTQEGGAGAKELFTFRNDQTSYPNDISAFTRNDFLGDFGGAGLMKICGSGSGTSQVTHCYNMDIIGNIFHFTANAKNPNILDPNTQDAINFAGGGLAGSELNNARVFFNAADWTNTPAGSGTKRLGNELTGTGRAYIGNVVTATNGSGSGLRIISNGSASSILVAKNNVVSVTSGYSASTFNSFTPSTDNKSFDGNNPFVSVPGTYENFDFTDLVPGNLLNNTGTLDAIPRDIDGDTRPNGITEPGVHEIP